MPVYTLSPFISIRQKAKMGDASQSENGPLFYLITYPRSCSNLLLHMIALDDQPNVFPASEHGGYFFMPFFKGCLKEKVWTMHVDQLSEEQITKMKQLAQSCAEALGEHVAKARSLHKMVVVKEHATLFCDPVAMTKFLHGPESTTQQPWSADPGPAAFGETLVDDQSSSHSPDNETILPDRFLKAFKPTFLIRNPVLALPSFFRAIKDLHGGTSHEVNKLSLTLHWSRSLYDWYLRQFQDAAQTQNGDVHKDGEGVWPIVLDADDVMTEPGVLMRFCEIVGLDKTLVRYSWGAATKEQVESMDQEHQRMLSTLLASSGINQSKLSTNLSVESEAPKWREEFGEEFGAMLETYVRAAMPDYEYMKSKRLQPAQ